MVRHSKLATVRSHPPPDQQREENEITWTWWNPLERCYSRGTTTRNRNIAAVKPRVEMERRVCSWTSLLPSWCSHWLNLTASPRAREFGKALRPKTRRAETRSRGTDGIPSTPQIHTPCASNFLFLEEVSHRTVAVTHIITGAPSFLLQWIERGSLH